MDETVKIENLCRTCLTKSNRLLDIFNENITKKLPSYKDMLMACSKLNIKKNDDLPQQICTTCSIKIENAFLYMQEVERVDHILRLKVHRLKENIFPNTETISEPNNITLPSSSLSISQDFNFVLGENYFINDTFIQFNNIKFYLCHNCDKCFLTYEDFNAHNEDHSKKTDQTINCRFCNKVFKKISYLLSHIFSKHLGQICFICGYCDKQLGKDLENHLPGCYEQKSDMCSVDNSKINISRKFVVSCDNFILNKSGESQLGSYDNEKEMVFICPVKTCSNVFESEEQLIKHLSMNHNKNGQAECHLCQKVFKHQKNLQQHLITHKTVKKYICNYCSKGFNHAHHLQNHEKIHTKETPYLCNECGKRFAVKYNLKVHMRRHSNEKPYSCIQCEKTFAHRSALIAHTRIHSGERSFMCSHCGKTFTTKGNLYMHTEKVHNAHHDFGIGSYKHTCRLCNEIYEDASKLTEHMKKHTRQYVCEICKKGFSLGSALENHLRTHSAGDRSHICSDCGAGFNRSEHLRTHILRKHTDIKPYTCEMCQKTFAQSGDLNAHRRTHTGEKPYVCQVCNHGFAQSNSLKVHMRTHTGERPYICSICNKGQCSSGALIQHMRTHNKTPKIDTFFIQT